VDLDVPDLELPERLAPAAYFVVCEAPTNLIRYARAGMAHLRVAVDDGLLCVEVRDDNCGGAYRGAGAGRRGLADRMQIVSAAASPWRARPERAPPSQRGCRSN
jgi:signal transduction histidine kinase